jgi:competence ComEA-like helix-hairpin-helix protein
MPVADLFVAEVEGSPGRSGIYTFPGPATIEEVLLQAGVARKHIPKGTSPGPLKSGMVLRLSQSDQGIRIQIGSMAAAKRLLYHIPVDLNKVRAEELTLIPGIGPALAHRIIRYRDHSGGFTRVEELQNIPGIGRKTVASLRRFLCVEDASSVIP